MSEPNASEEVRVAVPPRENLVRAVMPGFEIRSAESGKPQMFGHFAVFNTWSEINSLFEGQFLERIAPGAFKKTFKENRDNIRVLFDHGHDPSIGNKPLGVPTSLSEDDTGARYEVDLFDTSYVRDLTPALQSGQLGASFRFKVMRETFDDEPEPSDHNPKALPERTIQEVRLAEFGPVTFPAYPQATAGIRSITDEIVMRAFLEQPDRLRALLLTFLPGETEQPEGEDPAPEPEPDAPEASRAEPSAHPAISRRVTDKPLFGLEQEAEPSWQL